MIRLTRQQFKSVRLQDIYEYPTLKEFAQTLDPDSVKTNGVNGDNHNAYASDAEQLAQKLPAKFEDAFSSPETILLTGATGEAFYFLKLALTLTIRQAFSAPSS